VGGEPSPYTAAVKITALAGGVGGAKLLVGLDRATAGALTAVVNTADDATIYGVHVSPDIDIVSYWLAGLADVERGWGIDGDTFRVVDALSRLGGESWFRLGDLDFATCIKRTQLLASGMTLSAATDQITRMLGVRPRVLPMSDEPVRTKVVCRDGRTLEFQEYFVKERQAPAVAEVRFDGIAEAKPAPEVLESIEKADAVVVCPSNPVVSIGPILGLPGVRDALRGHERVIAVSPIIRGAPLKGPADRLLPALGAEVSASGVAGLYADFCSTFVVDETDTEQLRPVEELGIEGAALDTIMIDHDASERLATRLLTL
jgi:LPPG:FO 2-phospho-L-lactate transferase